MTKNPFLNALSATGYIALIVTMLTLAERTGQRPNQFIAPLGFISLFTLSAAVMGYIFGYQPLLLLIDGKKKPAVQLFLQTVGVFGFVTFLIFVLLFSGIIPR